MNRKLQEMQQLLDQELARESQPVRDQVESILKDKQKGEANVEKKLRLHISRSA